MISALDFRRADVHLVRGLLERVPWDKVLETPKKAGYYSRMTSTKLKNVHRGHY